MRSWPPTVQNQAKQVGTSKADGHRAPIHGPSWDWRWSCPHLSLGVCPELPTLKRPFSCRPEVSAGRGSSCSSRSIKKEGRLIPVLLCGGHHHPECARGAHQLAGLLRPVEVCRKRDGDAVLQPLSCSLSVREQPLKGP